MHTCCRILAAWMKKLAPKAIPRKVGACWVDRSVFFFDEEEASHHLGATLPEQLDLGKRLEELSLYEQAKTIRKTYLQSLYKLPDVAPVIRKFAEKAGKSTSTTSQNLEEASRWVSKKPDSISAAQARKSQKKEEDIVPKGERLMVEVIEKRDLEETVVEARSLVEETERKKKEVTERKWAEVAARWENKRYSGANCLPASSAPARTTSSQRFKSADRKSLACFVNENQG
ncbi:hypothetical protein BJ508DRAFT_410674 [Ascobolus immersus RN42]|uniref:Uncharacterized protein n=1 Tax=Ascobolus immersus RN42 TaxID=1160509 RepID=A0A3N4ISC8_ASCIM|nr:hypothetical protein BJ508DRAFT_410674 [Ascobolus immersus RN42]